MGTLNNGAQDGIDEFNRKRKTLGPKNEDFVPVDSAEGQSLIQAKILSKRRAVARTVGELTSGSVNLSKEEGGDEAVRIFDAQTDALKHNSDESEGDDSSNVAGNAPTEKDVRTAFNSIVSKIEENVLNDFDNATYNLKFFMAKESATVETIESEKIIVIAESGTTAGFSISELTIDTIVSPHWRTKNTIATNIKLKVVEPLGSTLFDRIRLGALALGIRDHLRTPLWLEIKFKGYNGPGENSYEGGEKILRTQSRLWKITLTDVKAEVLAGGTEYDITAVPLNETAFFDANRRLKETVNISTQTVGDFFQQLEKKLSSEQKYTLENLNANDFPSFRTVEFSLPQNIPGSTKPMKDWVIRGDDIFKNIRAEAMADAKERADQKNNINVKVEDGKTIVTFDRGTPIESIAEQVISSTIEGQSLAILGISTGVEELNVSLRSGREPERPSVIFNVDPEVVILSYNGIAKEYNTLTKYNIRPYRTFQPMVSAQQTEKSKNNQKRLTAMLTVSNIKKKYEWVYSGLNTEILDFKLNLDRAWFVQLPIFYGQDKSATTDGSVKDKNSTAQQVAKGSEDSETAREPSAVPPGGTSGQAVERLGEEQIQEDPDTEAERAIEAANKITQLSVDAPTEINATFFSASRSIPISSDLDRFVSTGDGRNLEQLRAIDPRVSKENRGSIFFAEDLSIISSFEVGANTAGTQAKNANIRDTTSHAATTESFQPYNIEGAATPGRSFFSAVLGQAYGRQSDMIQITMEIRGDPYWLGEPNPEVRRQQEEAGLADPERPDLTRASALFLFTMAFPVTPNDTDSKTGSNIESFNGTGLAEIRRKENGFNGVYQVRTVSHNFANGKFTQKLDAFADPLTAETHIIDAVANASL